MPPFQEARRARPLLLALLVAVGLPAAAAESYTVDPRHTFPVFEISHYGFSTIRGNFRKTRGSITLDREARTGTADITIDTAGINTGLEQFDGVLKGDGYFDAANHPEIRFVARRMEFDGDRPSRIPGELTLRGVTKPVTLTVSSFKCGVHPTNKAPLCGADAEARIQRSEWGMTRALPGVPDDVRLLIQVEALLNQPGTAGQ